MGEGAALHWSGGPDAPLCEAIAALAISSSCCCCCCGWVGAWVGACMRAWVGGTDMLLLLLWVGGWVSGGSDLLFVWCVCD